MHYFIGLDNGGTATKAAVFDRSGKEIGKAVMATAALTPAPGYVERDMEEMWAANCACVRKVLQDTGIDPADVAGVGIAGHGKGLYLWGKDGRPVRHGIISTDNRAWGYPEMWRKDGTEEKVFALSLQHILPFQAVSLLAWIRDHEPENYRNIRWIFECKDYVRFRLTGEAKAEITDYSGANLMNLRTRDYDPELLKLFGLTEMEPALPPLCRATELCGAVTEEAARDCGLMPGTPVIGGMFDINACAIAAGVTDSSRICMIAGTWSINEYPRSEPVTDGSVLMNSLFCLPEYYLIEESSPTSAGNNEWFVRELLPELRAEAEGRGESIYEVLNQWVDSIAATEFVPLFLPFLMASNEHPNARGCLIGLSLNHTRRHLARSVYEGIAFCHRRHLEKLLATRSREEPVSCIRLAGGAARSAVWAQMFADVMKLPVETVEANETGALGCAIATAVAVGEYPDLRTAVENMTAVSQRYEPDPGRSAVYDRKFALYCRAIGCLDGLWDEMQELIEEGNR
ncbi:MAG: carbohydrate kinase [Oscillospiraceae bacterium]|nr:carbohydrate kinase [Oscillospiraceae bacterium]